jgi:MFS family permease
VCSPASAKAPNLPTLATDFGEVLNERAQSQQTLLSSAFLLILIGQTCFGFAFSTFLLLPKYLTTELAVGPDKVGQITASAMIAAVLAVPLVGRAIDRYERRSLIVGGGIVSCLLSLAFIPIHQPGPLLFAVRALQGVGFALMFNSAATLVTDLAPPARMGQALGLFGVASLLTNAAAPALGEFVAARAGWAWVFGMGATAMALCSVIGSFLPKTSRRVLERSALRPRFEGRALRILYAAVIVGVAFGTAFTFSIPFAIARGAHAVSAFFIGYTLTAGFVRIVLGSWADRVGRQRVAMAALAVYAAALFAAADLRPGWLDLLGALVGVGHGLVYPALNAMVVEGVPSEHRGSTMALFGGCFSAGFAVSTLVLGSVARHAGYPVAFVVAGIATLSAIAVLGRSRPDPTLDSLHGK